ncbi:DUF1801 domain-containing protein [Natronospirillum operosum]|uniref:DUF1801 domain-containing protein n=1 Tax=Natronospirillum operosum TaxID=2759953 RepID=A0A4Z0WF00_9GAMM|nr:DUF1801 domain-containing protein [Natronospirillum operosum]TGG92906.1 DUF1801 domain-containing protein [Natronospirillum operosum]
MSNNRINSLLEDIRHQSEERYALVQALREMIASAGDDVTEEVKYGGFLFSSQRDFAGVFSYTRHVSVELSEGARLDDPHNVLEGGGKHRRHIKLQSLADIEQKQVGEYVRAAYRHQS